MFRAQNPDVRQEEDSLPWGRVLSAFVLAIWIACVLVYWAYDAMVAREAELRPSRAFPEKNLGPRREVGMVQQNLFDEAPLGEQLFEAQRAELERFGFVDREKGIVTIPIDLAIELVVQRSAP